jgi:nucleotide-binding universal stress UspA family protein
MSSDQPGSTKHSHDDVRLRRILVPIDFSDYSKNALNYAVTLAKQFQSELLLIYVVEPAIYPPDLGFGQVPLPNIERELSDRGKSGLDQLVKTNIPQNLSTHTIIKTGKPFLEIINTATEERIDLIVIATHGHTGVEHLFFGSTAEKVAKKAHCPVLMVRAQ